MSQQRRLFIGNLPFTTQERDLRALFEQAGRIISLRMPHDRDTQRFRGFAFIEYDHEQDAASAIARFHQTEVGGRTIIVNLAKPEEPRVADRTGFYRGRSARREARW